MKNPDLIQVGQKLRIPSSAERQIPDLRRRYIEDARGTGVLLLAFAVVAAACGDGKKTEAEAALKASQDAYAAVSADAQKVRARSGESDRDRARQCQSAMTGKDYAAVLTQTQGLQTRINELGGAISSKKAEYTLSWNDLSGKVPKLLAALQSRVDILAQSKRPPAGLTAATIESARRASAANQAWSDAAATAQSGDVAAAVSKGAAVKTQVLGLMRSLNMQVPPDGGD